MQNLLLIESPKLNRQLESQWDECFPYYAGFPESFASRIIESSSLSNKSSIVFDPWNGSGTTTFAAARSGYSSYGTDLNPVMVLAARARILYPTEASSIEPQAKSIIKGLKSSKYIVGANDPLLDWFDNDTTKLIRIIENRIRVRLVGSDEKQDVFNFDDVSCFASTFYVALFTICRNFSKRFQSTNPTWLKTPKNSSERLSISTAEISLAFVNQAKVMAQALQSIDYSRSVSIKTEILVGNSTAEKKTNFADLVITSPPYCTRIDYTAATRIELAILHPLLSVSREELSRQMIGSVKVPNKTILPDEKWGDACNQFLKKLKNHASKASSSYYYKTHIDYFQKLSDSIGNVSNSLKENGQAVLVVQDSYYKELHNDVPLYLTELAFSNGLEIFQRKDFIKKSSIGITNPKSKTYRPSTKPVESVICFKKIKY